MSWRPWLTLAVAVVVQAVVWGIGLASFTIWSQSWSADFHASHGAIMAVNTAMMIAMAVWAPTIGRFALRIPLRDMMCFGIGSAVLAFVMTAYAHSIAMVVVCQAVFLSFGMILTGPLIGQIIAVRLFQPQPGFAIGVATIGMTLGGMTMPLLVAYLIDIVGWRPTLYYLAGLVSALLLLVLAAMPRLAPPATMSIAVATPDLPAAAILRDPLFIGCTLIVTVLHFMYNGLFFNLAMFLHETGVTNRETARIVSVMALVGIAGTVAYGRWVDQSDYRLLLVVAALVTATGVAAAAFGGGYWLMLAVIPPMGAVAGGLSALLAAVLARRFGQANFARANSFSLPFTYASSLGPMLVGIGRDRLESYQITFTFLLGATVLAVAGMALLPRGGFISPSAPRNEGAAVQSK